MSNTADRNTWTTAFIIVGVAVVIILALFGAHKCNAQTVAFSPTQTETEYLQALYGNDYLAIMHAELREHIKNRVSEGREVIKTRKAELLESPEITPEEKQAVNKTLEPVKAREAVKAEAAKAAELEAVEKR